MPQTIKPDLCIIGAGALGTGLALRARGRGLHTVLVDRGRDEGGDPRSGQIGLAAFAHSAALAQGMRQANLFGLSIADPKPNARAIAERAQNLVDAVAPREAEVRLLAEGVTVLQGAPRFTDGQTLQVGDTSVRAGRFVVAVGATPVVPDLPGLAEVPFLTPDTIGRNVRKLTHLLVLGGTPEALVWAQVQKRLGSAVTLVPNSPILQGFDRETVAILLRLLRAEGIAIHDGGSITAIQPRAQGTGATLTDADGKTVALDVSHVLVAAGRTPDWTELGLEQARLRPGRDGQGFALAPEGWSSNRRIALLGSGVDAGQAHAVWTQGARLVDGLTQAGSASPVPAASVPRLVLTDPVLAQLGQTEHAGRTTAIHRRGCGDSDSARVLEQTAGLLKVLTGPKGDVLGAAIVGPGAGDIAAVLALAVQTKLSLPRLGALVLPHPSPTQLLADLAQAATPAPQPGRLQRTRQAVRRILPG